MAIERKKDLYEILIRFGPEGLSGAHAIDLERVIDTETSELLAERQGAARPITLEEVGAYLGEKNAALIESLEGARAEVDRLGSALAETQAELDRRSAELATAEARLAAVAGALNADPV